jgi:hypothetical protein
MMSFIGYVNIVVIKLRIYFNSHMRIVGQNMDFIAKWFHVFILVRCAYKQ